MKTMGGQTRLAAGEKLVGSSLAAEILTFLASEPPRLSIFLDDTGLSSLDLRAQVHEASFLHGLLDYIASDDSLLVSFAAFAGRPPERVAAEIARFRRPEAD